MLKLYDLTIEYKHNPLGLDEVQPRFSWKLESDKQDTVQTSYSLQVMQSGAVVWDSGAVESEQSILNEYLGPNLAPRTGYTWTVTVWDNHGESADAESCFETGLLDGGAFEGKAQWITHTLDKASPVSPVLYKDFVVTGAVKKARLYATALGMYEAQVNGEAVDDSYFHPGWTNYRKRLQYQTYAVTLHEGTNRVALTLANGWYKGKLGFMPTPNNYGDTTAALAALCITYEDGREEWLGTDESWLCTTGEVQFSEIYDGETQDFTAAPAAPQPVKLFEYGFDTLVGQENEPVRCLQRLPVIKEFTAPNGDHLFDFGQNLTGWVEVEIYGDKGQQLTLRHAESLDENGNFYTENLSWAKATDTYILGGGKQILHPHFTWHGFRYLCVEGLQYGQNVQFTACHFSTDLQQTGSFTCSDKRVNRLQQNIQWSQRDNFVDIPTDCPQRSERLGWTGDVTAFCPTAAFNENIMPFMTKWLRDLASELGPDVSMPQVVPNILGNQQDGAAFWGDVVTVLPWTLYRAYGDKRILQHSGGVGQNLQTPRKADIGGKVVVRCALALIAQGVCLGVQPQPVAVLEAGLPQPVFAALTLDKLDPVLHTVVAMLQNALVAVGAVERPRQHRYHIAPERRAVLLVAQNVRYDLRHTHIGAKLAGKVAQPLRHKRHNVLVEGSGGAERGHIARPAQTLAALRAVGGNVHKIVALAPLDVLLQTVHPLVRAGKTARLLQIRGEVARRKLHVLPVSQPLNAKIAEAVPSKMRVQNLLAAA